MTRWVSWVRASLRHAIGTPMCGIVFLAAGIGLQTELGVASYPPASSPAADDFVPGLACRGPDYQGQCQVAMGPAALTFLGSLLQLRGAALSRCPLRHAASGSVLLFNGEVFGGLAVPPGCNDGQVLLEALCQPSGPSVPAVLTSLRGPWALAFWHTPSQTLWFGRDPIGRRSLLLHLPRPGDGRLLLASSAPLDPGVPFEGFTELPPGIYSLRLRQPRPGEPAHCMVGEHSAHKWADPWVTWLAAFQRAPCLVAPAQGQRPEATANGQLGTSGGGSSCSDGAGAAELQGTGCLAAAGAAAAAGAETEAAGQQSQAVRKVLSALRRSVEVRCRCIEDHSPSPMSVCTPCTGQPNCGACDSTAAPAAAAAAGSRPQGLDTPPAPPPPLPLHPALTPAPVLILFSGGLDSTLMAALAHEALPPGVPIDLSSICFAGGTSPDRLAALDALAELCAFAPEREWRLIQVDCSLEDVDALRPRLLRLLAPRDTVMDLNIGAALWLATRAEGTLQRFPQGRSGQAPAGAAGLEGAGRAAQLGMPQRSSSGEGGVAPAAPETAAASREPRQHTQGPPPPPQQQGSRPPQPSPYRSAARVVLLGHGADELCGGYGRHRTKFREGGWEGLDAELTLDLSRLWQRNLGRDDRLVADLGREARHPFLDEGVVAAVLESSLESVADLRLPPGAGDKRLLRGAARALGLPRAAARQKRAIQFGTGLGKLSNVREFGSNRAANVRNAGGLRLADLGLGD